MNIDITPATREDAEALAQIQKQAFKRLYEIYQDKASPYLRGPEEILAWLDRPNWHIFKIHANGVLCGGLSFFERNGLVNEYYLARVFILPAYQSQGIATEAILRAEKTVPQAISWTVDYPVEQVANRRCYEKAGYRDTGERRVQNGGPVTLAFMEKKTSSPI